MTPDKSDTAAWIRAGLELLSLKMTIHSVNNGRAELGSLDQGGEGRRAFEISTLQKQLNYYSLREAGLL